MSPTALMSGQKERRTVQEEGHRQVLAVGSWVQSLDLEAVGFAEMGRGQVGRDPVGGVNFPTGSGHAMNE